MLLYVRSDKFWYNFIMDEYDRLGKKYKSPMHYVLSGLIPYTEANVKLSFKPNLFFNDLERLDQIKISRNGLRSTYYRAIKVGYIEFDKKSKKPKITDKGRDKLLPFEPRKLKDSKLMVIFDIPEKDRSKRRDLRLLLKELAFIQVQKSVWISSLDSREYIGLEIKRLKIDGYVQIYEASKIK